MARRDDIVVAAESLFATRGFHSTTVSEISSEVGLSPSAGGIYRHFSSKEALLEAVVDLALERVAESERRMGELLDASDPPPEHVRLVGLYLLARIQESKPLLKILERDLPEFPELYERAAKALVEPVMCGLDLWIGSLGPSPDDPALDVAALVDVFWGALVQRSMYGRPDVSDERFVDAWATSLLGAVGTAPTRPHEPRPTKDHSCA